MKKPSTNIIKNYNFKEIEKKWQDNWKKTNIYKAETVTKKKKFYILDMFPYPSGAGLHVGHPLGYVASDILARYKKLKGYNVLHPMGFDSFGLPAEQYAIETGAHPADTTKNNITKYKSQLQSLGLGYDWSREITTSDPSYYRWTQWVFIKFFNSWYDKSLNKARPISEIIDILSKNGSSSVNADVNDTIKYNDKVDKVISSSEWSQMDEKAKYSYLSKYRLAYLSEINVNWCPELGTVLANEEVKDGFSERGGFPVIKKKMKQWCLKITAYADRLLENLEELNWSTSIKETQKNWIGKSRGTEISFEVPKINESIKIFTTRPDTVFGVTYIALAPEHPILEKITLSQEIQNFISITKNKSNLERDKNIKEAGGIYLNIDAIHPLTGKTIPIWVSEYVLSNYGTGAVMGVPAHDSRDYLFAIKYNIPIIKVIEGGDISKEAYETKKGKLINSEFLNGFEINKAINIVIDEVQKRKIGIEKNNYRIRDAIFSRQRYWGEPFPVYYKEGFPHMLDFSELPLKLPEVDNYKPTINGDPPLANAQNWKTTFGYDLELNTMPGWAGSSWYLFKYMDPNSNNIQKLDKQQFLNYEILKYWKNVDIYIGGSEHATGHLIYSRFWTKFLYDLGYVPVKEPFKKLINQGMIQGVSKFVYRIKGKNCFVSYGLKKNYKTTKLYVDINLVKNNILDIDEFKKWKNEYSNTEFILENGKYKCGSEVEKMSKSKYNTINPDDIIKEYGADTLRLYSMFLGPLEHSKPWNMNGIGGVFKFLNKLWILCQNSLIHSNNITFESLESINRLIKKVEEDIERYSFNTCISAFMICVNELSTQKCYDRSVLEKLLICLAPFAPHFSEEVWALFGNSQSIFKKNFPEFDLKYLKKDTVEYPIAFNGKTKLKIFFPIDLDKKALEREVLNHDKVSKLLKNKQIKKIIIINNKMINFVV